MNCSSLSYLFTINIELHLPFFSLELLYTDKDWKTEFKYITFGVEPQFDSNYNGIFITIASLIFKNGIFTSCS